MGASFKRAETLGEEVSAAAAAPEVDLLEDLKAPEIAAHRVTGYHLMNGALTLTLDTTRVSYFEGAPKSTRVVVGRVMIPASAAVDLAVGLFDFLVQQGVALPRNQRGAVN